MSIELIVVLIGAFLSAFAVGLAGFADALIASAVWLHVLTPVQAVPLILATGMVIHLVSLTYLRRRIALDLLWPFLIGGTIGVPLGTWLLRYIEPEPFRITVGAMLVGYSAFALVTPRLAAMNVGSRGSDGAVGLVGGVLGGFAGLSGVVPTLWSGLRGWSKDVQRGVYQSFIFVMHGMALAWLASAGVLDHSLGNRFLWCLPFLILGTWLGLKLYRRVDEQQFRRLILALLLISGAALLIY
ncbi:MAG: sulfite exporter TauE/SafE family protein [Acidiferrobacterales bacterium]